MTNNHKLFKFGTLYLDGVPQEMPDDITKTPHYQAGQAVSIGDTAPGCTLTWVEALDAGFLIADRNILYGISKDELKKIVGTQVVLNGWLYELRLPTVESNGTSKAFWTNFTYQISKAAFHWGEALSYGTDHNFDDWSGSGVSDAPNLPVGFRPVLVPICPQVFTSGKIFVLDGQEYGLRQENLAVNAAGHTNFTPVLYPLLPDMSDTGAGRLVDCNRFKGMKTMRAYTLLMDGKPVNQQTKTPVHYKWGAELELTDKAYADKYLISWEIKNGCAYAARTLLNSAYDNCLYEQGLM